jgi:hypothetical protein
MSVERGENAGTQASNKSNVTASEDERSRNARSGEEEKKVSQEVETLGVLLVHGIGSQGRGDTLVQCTTALHSWMRDWLAQGGYENEPTVDLADVSIAEAGPDRPAQAKIIFRRRRELGNVSWLIAESCWFETYRRPSFYEFMRWALWVIPIALLVHFVPSYRRTYNAFDAARRAEKEKIAEISFRLNLPIIQRELGLSATALEDLKRQDFLARFSTKMMVRLLVLQSELALAGIAGLVVQTLLIVVGVFTIIPGITRSLAGWVQRKISQTLGDSYLFVTSPITGAAIVTRVKKDLEWLMARTDRVIVLAHSQGAAVSYRAIEREFWGGGTVEKLDAHITYGSGLRKLFDLETNVQANRIYWIILCVWSTVVSVFMAALIVLFLSGVVPWWAVLLGLLVGVVLEMGPLLGGNVEMSYKDPTVLRVPWLNLYSSHDPVPNGPMEVVPTEDGVYSADLILFEAQFKSLQREVVNRRSILSDHTSYWSSRDDFVGTVAGVLAKASDIPILLTLDEEWLKVSTVRRLWRVKWLSRCRAVTGLAALSILFWPRDVLRPAGSYVQEVMAAIIAKLPERLAAWLPAPPVPDWLMGAGGLALGTYLVFLVALAGWSLWERRELARFFRREPHPSPGVAGWIFALGWVGVLVSAPAYALFALAHAPSHWDSFLAVLWAPVTLAAASAWAVSKSDPGPGSPLEWGRTVLARAEGALADEKRERIDALKEAKFCFGLAHKRLEARHSGSDEWVRAVLGETEVVEELSKSDPAIRDQAPEIYQKAVEALKRARRDASEVQARLERVGAASID